MVTDTKTARNMKLASEIFEEHSDTIRAAIRFHVNDKSSIDDIFQEFFLSLVKRPIPQKVENIKGYLSKAVKNDVLDAAFQAKSCHQRNCKYTQMHTERFESPSPDDLASHAEAVSQLLDIIKERLYQHEIEAVMQRYLYDRDIDEGAETMGISKRSFSCYLSTGIKKIRKFTFERDLERIICFISANFCSESDRPTGTR